jgi:hypothetical protein
MRSMLGGLEAGKRRGARIPCEVPEVPISTRRVAEALRSHSRGSEKVIEAYSPLILKLVS